MSADIPNPSLESTSMQIDQKINVTIIFNAILTIVNCIKVENHLFQCYPINNINDQKHLSIVHNMRISIIM